MTNEVYRAWLTDRGIDSPGSQPFQALGSKVHLESSSLILAQAPVDQASSVLLSITRLAEVLSATNKPLSWILIDGDGPLPDLKLLCSFLPAVKKIIRLTKDPCAPEFECDTILLAGRELQVFQGPTLGLMSSDSALKRAFWNDVRPWLLN